MNTNIDSTEVDKFNKLADQWWDTDGKLKTLHAINPLRCNFISSHCQVTNKQLIDVGCGGGVLAEALAKSGAMVTGIDMSENAIAVAKQHSQQQDLAINYHHAPIEQWAKQHPGQYDIVTCMELLEHVPEPKSVIAACADLLAPGGYGFLSTINRNAKAYLLAIMMAEYVLKMLPKGTHDYQRFIRPAELANYCRGVGLTVVGMSGIGYNPLSSSFRTTKDTQVNYLMCVKKAVC